MKGGIIQAPRRTGAFIFDGSGAGTRAGQSVTMTEEIKDSAISIWSSDQRNPADAATAPKHTIH